MTELEKVTDEYYSEEFNDVNNELRKCFKTAHDEIDKVKEKVNELVVIIHNDNSKWSLKRICNYIAGRNDDLEPLGFSAKTILNYLTEENKNILTDSKYDHNKKHRGKLQNKVMEPEEERFPPHVIEQSSSSGKEQKQQNQPSPALEEFRNQHGTVEQQEEPEEEQTVIIDPQLLDRKIEEIAKLEQEIDDLKDLIQNIKKEKVESNMSKSYTSDYDIEFNDNDLIAIRNNAGICPLTITSYPEKKQSIVRFDRSRLNKKQQKR